MPSEMAAPKKDIDMRRTKLTAAEAAMLAGEMNKPSWQSRNEGIHERVSFEDSIWGFDLAGGSFYKTPLRVTAVKADSRAEKAGIRPGDKLLRINDIDTSTLTIQEAHEIIIESGVYLRIAVTAPDDEEDSYFCWEDPLEQGYDSEEERRREKEKAKKREVHAKVSSYWSLQWPWVSKRRVIYRESNCFMVPSKYEDRHRDKFPIPTFGPKVQDDIVLFSGKNKTNTPQGASKTEAASNPVPNGNKVEDAAKDSAQNEQNSQPKTKAVDDKVAPNTEDFTNVNGQDAKHADLETKSKTETVEENTENVLSHTEDMASVIDNPSENNEPEAMTNGISEENNAPEAISNGFHENEQMETDAVEENKETLEVAPAENNNTENPDVEIQSDLSSADDEILNEVLEKPATPNGEMEDKTFEDILNESDANTNDEAVDETQR